MEGFFAQLLTLSAFILDIFMFITIPVYLLVLITIWKNRKEEALNHAFFKLMLSTGIADMGTILTIFLCVRIAEWGWAPEVFIWLGGTAARIAYTLKYLFGGAQALSVLVVAINRYTSYMMPLRHQKLWREGRLLTWAIFAIWIISLIGIIPVVFYYPFQIYISSNNRSVYHQWVSAYDLLYYGLPVTMIGKNLVVIIVFIIYGVIFVKAVKSSFKNAAAKTRGERTALNMAIVGFIHCIGLAISSFFFTAQEIAYFGYRVNLTPIEVTTFVINLGQDSFSAVNPYALLIFSSPVRRYFIKMYHIPTIKLCRSSKTNVQHITDDTRTAGQSQIRVEL